MEYRLGGSRLSENARPRVSQSLIPQKSNTSRLSMGEKPNATKKPATPSRTPLRPLQLNGGSAMRTRSAKRNTLVNNENLLSNDSSAVSSLKFEDSSDDFDVLGTPSWFSLGTYSMKSHIPQPNTPQFTSSQPSILSAFSPASPPHQHVQRPAPSFPDLMHSPVSAPHFHTDKEDMANASEDASTSMTVAADTLLEQARGFRAEKESAGGDSCLACDLFEHACTNMADLVRRAEEECAAAHERYVRSHRAGQAALAQGEEWRQQLHAARDDHERLKMRYELLREQCGELEQHQQQALADAARNASEAAALREDRDALAARVRSLEAQLERERETQFSNDSAAALRGAGRESMVGDGRRRTQAGVRNGRR